MIVVAANSIQKSRAWIAFRDRQTDRQTDGQTDRWTDRHWPSMHYTPTLSKRRHNNWQPRRVT